MKISELARRSDLPIATVKFYLREGMLDRGVSTGATSAEYDDSHLARLRLITALADVRGLPLARVREILDLVDAPLESPLDTLGRAVSALPPYVEGDGDLDHARAAVEASGFVFEPRFAAVGQLESAIRGVLAAGLPWDDATLARYAGAARQVAAEEIAPVADMSLADALAYAVLGTALYEPVLLALRRLAHHDLLVRGAAAATVPDAPTTAP